EQPRVFIDTSIPASTGRTIAVAAGADLQAALDAAQPGDVITLAAGASFVGNFRLPNTSGSGWIIIRSSATAAELPPPGPRVSPANAAVLPKIVSPNGSPAISLLPARTMCDCSGWRSPSPPTSRATTG